MRKIFRKIIDTLWMLRSAFAALAIPLGSIKVNKWLKANKKNQDPYLHSYKKRHEKLIKIAKKVTKGLNIRIKVIGKDNLLKGPMWIVANHSAQYDGMYIAAAIGDKTEMSIIVKNELKNNRYIKGILASVDAFFIDRANLRDGINVLNRAANYAKQNNRSIVIFPEGTRSEDTIMKQFKGASFAFPQKYALPILPISIAGTLEARRWWIPARKTLFVTIHKPIKAIEHIKIPRDILARRAQKEIQKGLDLYIKNLTPEQKKFHDKLMALGLIVENKKRLNKKE